MIMILFVMVMIVFMELFVVIIIVMMVAEFVVARPEGGGIEGAFAGFGHGGIAFENFLDELSVEGSDASAFGEIEIAIKVFSAIDPGLFAA